MPVPSWIEGVYARSPTWARRVGYLARTRPGHYYSPYPDLNEVERRAHTIWAARTEFAGIDMRADAQWALLDELSGLAAELPFGVNRAESAAPTRYRADNRPYGLGDATVLGAMLRRNGPRRYVEVGSGWSTAVAIDVREHFDLDFSVVAIDPYPQRLLTAIGNTPDNFEIKREAVQDTTLDLFDDLEHGDVVVIDSTHVVRAGGDVNHLIFDVLPRLATGVAVHIHDVFDGFEYPQEWVQARRAWTESYLLRAFLQFNTAFEITLFTAWLYARDPLRYEAALPAVGSDPGAQIWITRT